MDIGLSGFENRISKDGYEICSAANRLPVGVLPLEKDSGEYEECLETAGRLAPGETTESSLFLVQRGSIHSRQDRTASVKPFDHRANKAVFRRFANLPLTHDAIAGFAGEFGLLGKPFTESIWINLGPGHDSFVVGEPPERWFEEIHEMKIATDLWSLVKAGDRAGTARFLMEQAELEVEAHAESSLGSGPLYASRRLLDMARGLAQPRARRKSEKVDLLPDGHDPLDVATDCLVAVINWRLCQGVGIDLKPVTKRRLGEPRVQLGFSPHSLHMAMWIEFALAVEGTRTYEECAYCREWFKVPINHRGRPRRYCSESCRQKQYHHAKADAKALWRQEASLEEIVFSLGLSSETATKWIRAWDESRP